MCFKYRDVKEEINELLKSFFGVLKGHDFVLMSTYNENVMSC